MIRKIFKKKSGPSKFDAILDKYKIPREFLAFNRRTVSRGVAIGLFVGLIPMPMQMVVIVMLLPIFRFNVLVGFSMVWLSNPVTMPFMYYVEYLTGNFLLGLDGIENIELSLDWFKNNLDDILIPLYVGTLFYCVTISSSAYYLINYLWIRSVHKEKKHRKTLWQKLKAKGDDLLHHHKE